VWQIEMMSKTGSQLTEIYNLLCRSALNKEYYGTILHKTQTWNDVLEIIIAIGATGTAISALTIWTIQPYGPWVWGTLTAISATLAVAKPILQLNKRIERLTRLFVGHTDNYTNLLIVVSRIKRQGDVTPELVGLFETAEARFLDLSKEDDPRPNLRLLTHCEALVRERHPPQSAWYPEASTDTMVAVQKNQ
jgi:hypothetical protein